MNFNPKPTPELQAQLAFYADEQHEPGHNGRNDTLLAQLASNAIANPIPDVLTRENAPIKPALRTKHPYYPQELLLERQEYGALLATTPKWELANLADMITTYKTIKTQIDATDIHTDLPNAQLRPDFIGAGRNNIVFSKQLLINGEVKDVAVIVPRPHPDFSEKSRLNERAVALSKVKGFAGVEQGIAVSYDPAVLVIENVPGKSVDQLSYQELHTIPAKHWQALSDNVRALEGRVGLDANPSNYLYDPSRGFTVIDIGRAWGNADQITSNQGIVERLRMRYGGEREE